jgi:hypothetical protein
MSRSTIRIAFSVALSLLVVAFVYTSVLGAPLGAAKIGTHQVKVNLDHYRLTEMKHSSYGTSDSLSPAWEGGHGCGAEQTDSPDD